MDWSGLEIPKTDFDVAALQAALEARKAQRGLSWKTAADEVNRAHERRAVHPISPSTLSGLAGKRWGVEGDGVLQMLLWLERSPESFVPGHPGADLPEARLPDPGKGVLRFDVTRIHAALDAGRQARGMSWGEVAAEVGGPPNTAESLARMGQARRAGFPWVMRLTRWLRAPAAAYTRVSPW